MQMHCKNLVQIKNMVFMLYTINDYILVLTINATIPTTILDPSMKDEQRLALHAANPNNFTIRSMKSQPN